VIVDIEAWPVWAVALAIYSARVADVTLGTLRISFISRGEKNLAPVIAFVEMMIWLVAISQLVQHLDNPVYYVAYAGGFASGVFTGLRIEDRLALGSRMIRIVTRQNSKPLVDALRAAGYGVTTVPAQGGAGEVSLFFSVVKRAEVPAYMALVSEHHPGAFSSVEEVRSVESGVFRAAGPAGRFPGLRALRHWRKQ